MVTDLAKAASAAEAQQRVPAGTAVNSRSPGSRLNVWVFVVFCIATVAGIWRRAGDFYTATLDIDESVYIVMARRWLEGDLPYVAVYDQHPIGLPALLTAATWLVGDGLFAARLTAVFAVSGTCAALFFAGAWFARSRAAGVVAAALYGIYMMRPEAMVSNTELYNNLFVTLAACLLFGQARRVAAGGRVQRPYALIAAGLLGAGLQIKYVVAPEAAGFCLAFLFYWAWHERQTRRVLGLAVGMMLAGLVPTLVAVLYFWSEGALQPFLDANIRSNLAYVAAVPPFDEVLYRIYVGVKPLAILMGGTLALAAVLRHGRSRPAPVATQRVIYACMLWVALSVINIVLPMKFFGHYFYALLPPFCLMAAILMMTALERAWWAANQRQTPLPRALMIALATMFLALPPLRAIALQITAPDSLLPRATEFVTACIREHPASRPGLYVFNWDPILYETTRIPPPTRYVLPAELAEFSDSAGLDPTAEITRILATRPGHIVVASASYLPFSPERIGLVQQAVRAYDLACSVDMRVGKEETGKALVYRLQ